MLIIIFIIIIIISLFTSLMSLLSLFISLLFHVRADEESVVNYWLAVKAGLTLTMQIDILSDYYGESALKKPSRRYSWLTYGLPLHRLRGSA